jgi:hypothetical protein
LNALNAQTNTYTVNGQSYELQTEVEGPMTLLWNVIGQEYRYFIKKGNEVTALENTKVDGKYQAEYLGTLQALTKDAKTDTNRLRLTLGSLRKFVNDYNTQVDPTYEDNSLLVDLEYRLGAFGGVTNNVFTTNPENLSVPQFGIDFELYDPTALPSHAVVIQFKQTLSSDEFDYQSSQFSLNYRLKFIKSKAIDVYLNTKLVTLTSAKRDSPLVIEGEDGSTVTIDQKGTNLQGPFIFGLGADIRLGKGFLTLNYHDAFSFVIDDNGEFPLDVSLGYKFIL